MLQKNLLSNFKGFMRKHVRKNLPIWDTGNFNSYVLTYLISTKQKPQYIIKGIE